MYPILFRSGDLVISTYLALISFVSCVIVVWAYARATHLGLSQTRALDLTIIVMIGGFAGARLAHEFYEYPEIYLKDPLRIAYFWEGGFVFYGGAILGTLAGLIFLKAKKEPFAEWLDFAAPLASLGYAVGRVACFLGGCCFGKTCDLPWAVKFPAGVEAPEGVFVHPTQLYATLWETATLAILLFFESRNSRVLRKKGDLFFVWITLHGIGRILMESFRDDFRGSSPGGLSISSWISLAIIGLGFFFYLKPPPSKSKPPRSLPVA